jgi:hypothetical protein
MAGYFARKCVKIQYLDACLYLGGMQLTIEIDDFRPHNSPRTKANPTLLFIVALIK